MLLAAMMGRLLSAIRTFCERVYGRLRRDPPGGAAFSAHSVRGWNTLWQRGHKASFATLWCPAPSGVWPRAREARTTSESAAREVFQQWRSSAAGRRAGVIARPEEAAADASPASTAATRS